MSYQSPLHIIKSFAGDSAFDINSENLVRLRKRLLAELNLSGKTTITVNKKDYSKDEIIKTIDQLLGSSDLALHEFIYKHEFLLRYLEDENQILHPHVYNGFDIPDAIRHHFEPLITDRIILQFRKGVSSRAFNHAKNAMELTEFLPEHLRSLFYEEAHGALHALNLFLYELENNLSTDQKKEIQFLSLDAWGEFLNALPEAFEGVKYDLVNRTINVVVAYHKLSGHDKELAKDISAVLTTVVCDDEQAVLIKSNHKVFSDTGALSGGAALRFLVIMAVILFNVARFCDRSDHSDNYSFPGNGYVSTTPQMIPTTQAYTAGEEIRLYKKAVDEKHRKVHETMDEIMFDTLRNPGINPFFYGFKLGDYQTYEGWNKVLEVNNNTDAELIVFSFDSAKTGVLPTYIQAQGSGQVRFADRNRFIFYFGHTLMRCAQRSDFAEHMPGYYEYFKTSDNSQMDLLYRTYKIKLKQSGIKTSKPYSLTLDSSFYQKTEDAIKLKKFSLTLTDL